MKKPRPERHDLFMSFTQKKNQGKTWSLDFWCIMMSPSRKTRGAYCGHFLPPQDRLCGIVGFWNGPDNGIWCEKWRCVNVSGKQHKQACVIYSDKTHYPACPTCRDKHRQGWGKDGKLGCDQIRQGLKCHVCCLFGRLSRITKILCFEGKEWRKHHDLWGTGMNTDYDFIHFISYWILIPCAYY